MRPNHCIALFIVSSITWLALHNVISQNIQSDGAGKRDHINERPKNESKTAFENRVNKTYDPIAVLVIACNRVTVSRCLEKLIKCRPSKRRFPIIVSQDCVHPPTTQVIRSYSDHVFIIRQPDQSDISVPPEETAFKGYYKIARHYKWALNQTFEGFNYEAAIVVEDDLDVSPDFYEYFASTLTLLRTDKTLWCVSAWNDNGKSHLVNKNANALLYRTDFFPGLGWMLTKSLWRELAPKWPKSYWDDWMREPEQRKERSCIRPEVSRTFTFGRIGVSNGLFYDTHLRYIYLNEKAVKFMRENLTYLFKEVYDPYFVRFVYDSPIVSIRSLKHGEILSNGSVRILYDSKDSLIGITKSFGLTDDIRGGVPRTGYMGVISFYYDKRRVFITPNNSTWTGYDPSW